MGSSMWMYVINCVLMMGCSGKLLSRWLSILHSKIFKAAHYSHRFLSNSFRPAILTGIIDLYQFEPVLVALTLRQRGGGGGGGVTRIAQSKTPWLHFLAYLWADQVEIWCWSSSSWTSWCYFWVRFIESKEIPAVLWCKKRGGGGGGIMLACIQLFMNWFVSNFVWWYLYYWIPTLDSCLSDLDLQVTGVQDQKENNPS